MVNLNIKAWFWEPDPYPNQLTPGQLKIIFSAFHHNHTPLDDSRMDKLLGLDPLFAERDLNNHLLEERNGYEQYVYEGTPYNMIREFLHELCPSQNDIVYDLGAGYGRVLFYGALTTEAQYRGIEIVVERVAECKRILNKWNLDNITLIVSNVLEEDISDGTIFFLFNPFTYTTLVKTIAKIETAAKQHPIKIVSWGGPSDRELAKQEWLVEIRRKTKHRINPYTKTLRFFESR